MTLPGTVADVLSNHVVLEVECIDRLYLNVYQPRLQYPAGAAAFFVGHRGARFASSALMDPISRAQFTGSPVISRCRWSSSPRGSARTTSRTSTWPSSRPPAEHAATTTRVFLDNPRLSGPERAGAQTTFDRAGPLASSPRATQPPEQTPNWPPMASEQQADVEVRTRAAIELLLTGDVPKGLKCDVQSLCLLAGVPRATLYPTYPQLKAEFEQRRRGVQATGREPDPRLAQIQRLKTELLELRTRLGRLNTETTELKTFRAGALSRLRPPAVGTRSPLRFRAGPAGRPVVDGRRVGAPGWR